MAFPHVIETYWREVPTSTDLIKQPFYKCPYTGTCLGGNDTKGRCVDGHSDTAGPVCAVCDEGYVIQGERCVLCPGIESKAGAAAPTPPGLWAVFFSACTIAFVALHIAITRPALSKKDQQRVRELIVASAAERGLAAVYERMLNIERKVAEETPSSGAPASMTAVVPISGSVGDEGNDDRKPNDGAISRNTFTVLLVELRASLSEAQIEQLFEKIDGDGNGVISLEEFQKFVGDENKVTKLKVKRESKKETGTQKSQERPKQRGRAKPAA
jgi:hypothetical protein